MYSFSTNDDPPGALMRIVSGRLKGMKLKSPNGGIVRPTTGNIREAVFNILGQDLSGTDFIDLCSGTGAMGLEAASRGANNIFFVERDRKVAQILRDNVQNAIKRIDQDELTTRIYEESFEIFLRREYKASFIYFDPPYDYFYCKDWALKPYSKIVKPGGFLLMEHPKREPRQIPEFLDGLELRQTRKYGKSSLSIFESVQR